MTDKTRAVMIALQMSKASNKRAVVGGFGKGEGPVQERSQVILVVDDNDDLLSLIAESLRKLGSYTVYTARDGIEGLERYFDVRPDCVVVDVKMPGLDGYQLVRALRGDPESRSTPVVILSAMAQPKDQLSGLLSGADEYLVKPVGPLDLVKVISMVIGRSETERCQRQQDLLEQAELDAEEADGES